MANKVVHLSDEIHNLAKQYCKERGMRMNDWVTKLIKEGIQGNLEAQTGVTPVRTGKSLPKLEGRGNGEEIVSRPPFWNSDQAS